MIFVSGKMGVLDAITDFITPFSGLTFGFIPLSLLCTFGKIVPLVLAYDLV